MILNGVTYTFVNRQLNISFIDKCMVFTLDENFESATNERTKITPLKDVYKTSDVDFNFVSISGQTIDGFFIVVNGNNKYYFTFDSNALQVDGVNVDIQSDDAIVAFYNSLISKKS